MKLRTMLKGAIAVTVLSGMLTGAAFAEETAVAESIPLMTISRSGYLAITLPSNDWKEVAIDDACVAFSDGKSIISFDHYEKEDEIWHPSLPDGTTGYYYRTIDVHGDNKLVFEAYSESEAEMALIKESLAKAKVNTDLLPKEEKHEIVVSDYSIEPCDYMAYVTADELNVRPEGDKNGNPIGIIYRGEEVHVTGKILINGAPNGWVQIDFNSGKGYVSTDFLSDNPVDPAPQPTPSENPTFEQIVDKIDHYENKYMSDGFIVKIVVLNDGTMLDMNGNRVEGIADATLRMSDGTLIYDFDPTRQSLDDFLMNGARTDDVQWETTAAGDRILYAADGSGDTHLMHEEGGGWVDDDGFAVYDNGDGTWTSNDGRLWN